MLKCWEADVDNRLFFKHIVEELGEADKYFEDNAYI